MRALTPADRRHRAGDSAASGRGAQRRPGDPAVDAQIAGAAYLYERAASAPPLEFLPTFRGRVGSTHETPERLEGELPAGVRPLMAERPPWEPDPPLEELRASRFPKLVISGGHSSVVEAVCDALAEHVRARRAVIGGRGHTIPATGQPYYACLHE